MTLSKTAYCRGLRCPKILWLDHHKPEEKAATPAAAAIMEAGTQTGCLARQYFGEYTLVEYAADKSKMTAETQRLLQGGANCVCEASFSHNGTFCSVDMLRVTKSGYEIVEVKSAAEVKDSYLDDLGFQYHVLTSCGLKITGASLMHINSKYVRRGDLDLHSLFTLVDLTKQVQTKQAEIPAVISRLKAAAESETEDAAPIGLQCGRIPACDYHA
jgi:hypothetical protein